MLKIWGSQKAGDRGNPSNLGWSKICKSALIEATIEWIFVKN